MKVWDRIKKALRRKPPDPPVALSRNGVALRPGMRIRLAEFGEGVHRVGHVVRDGVIEVIYSDGVRDTDRSDKWIPVRRRR